MIWELANAQLRFQHVLDAILLEGGVDDALGFLSDITVGGMVEEWRTLWANFKSVFHALVARGFYLNL